MAVAAMYWNFAGLRAMQTGKELLPRAACLAVLPKIQVSL